MRITLEMLKEMTLPCHVKWMNSGVFMQEYIITELHLADGTFTYTGLHPYFKPAENLNGYFTDHGLVPYGNGVMNPANHLETM